ncbi:hypothetical protein LTR78_009648 [Recurvomyces mirabilis]|uniref:Major facilitator superfamily (MFS) profile domain-containing protein n=1 Tax=Recurvomyces mirabilis TaxID=574656 RepID=A0AAE0TN96_9PEZI|nr:hypothetical protein LTR78_009648 [Recurvomyces mirabilis]KAK5150308.1 hypothetical protein LTS14_010285 [Recurvomyces mirabilis]
MQSFFQQSRLRRDLARRGQSNKAPVEAAEQPVKYEPMEKDASDAFFLVEFEGPHDSLNPQNWPTWKKVSTNSMTAAVAFISGFASSIESPVIPQAAREFHVSEEAESLATVLFLVGFGAGAPLAGPLSETFGRNSVYITFMILFCCWILGTALAPNFGAQLVLKFLAGFCGSTAFTTAGGTLGDCFDHQKRGKIFPYFGMIALLGPMIAPVAGAYVGWSGMDWRWVEWIALCISGGLLIIMILFLPETYAPTILTWKAKALRAKTGETRWKSPQESTTPVNLGRKLAQALYRPVEMLLTEPIIAVLTTYLTFVYIVSFSFFTGAPYIFTASYDFNQGSAYLMFVATSVGVCICGLATPIFGILIGREYKKAAANGKDHAEPEAMLWWAMVAAPILPICLFWLAWSDYPDFSYWSPIIACAFFGFTLLALFLSTYLYIIQSFTTYAASALVAITLVRYVVAGSMVLVSIPMYKNLGVHHAPTVLAGIATAFLPVPYVLYSKGKSIRGASRRIGTVEKV